MDEETKNQTRIDVARVLVRTKYLLVLNQMLNMEINKNVFCIKMVEDSHGPKRIICPKLSQKEEEFSEFNSNSEDEDDEDGTHSEECIEETSFTVAATIASADVSKEVPGKEGGTPEDMMKECSMDRNVCMEGGGLELRGRGFDILDSALNFHYEKGTHANWAQKKSKLMDQEGLEVDVVSKKADGAGDLVEVSDPISSLSIRPKGLGLGGNNSSFQPTRKKSMVDILEDMQKQSDPSYFNVLHPSKDRNFGDNTVQIPNRDCQPGSSDTISSYKNFGGLVLCCGSTNDSDVQQGNMRYWNKVEVNIPKKCGNLSNNWALRGMRMIKYLKV